ncbi:hypothetical protein vseg_007895 [Gypsophila vaccaria]
MSNYSIWSYIGPYRFGKQFAFFQGVPSLLEPNTHTNNVSLEEAMKVWQMLIFAGSQSRVYQASLQSQTWRDSNLIAYETWWKKVRVYDLLDNALILNSSLDHDPSKKTSKTKRKKRVTSDSSNHTESESTAGSPFTTRSLSKPVVTYYSRRKLSNEDEGSDTNFKHRRRGVVAPATADSERYNLPLDDFFANIPYSNDAPLGLALDGDFNLDDEVPMLLDEPVHNVLNEDPISNRGKELDTMKPVCIESHVKSLHLKDNRTALSPSNSQRSVDGPHSVEVVAKSLLENQRKTPDPTVSCLPTRTVFAPSQVTVMPETAVRGILNSGLMSAASSLLRAMKEAAFDDVEKISKEAFFLQMYKDS